MEYQDFECYNGASNKERSDKEEDSVKDEEESATDKGEDFTQRMKSDSMMNYHI